MKCKVAEGKRFHNPATPIRTKVPPALFTQMGVRTHKQAILLPPTSGMERKLRVDTEKDARGDINLYKIPETLILPPNCSVAGGEGGVQVEENVGGMVKCINYVAIGSLCEFVNYNPVLPNWLRLRNEEGSFLKSEWINVWHHKPVKKKKESFYDCNIMNIIDHKRNDNNLSTRSSKPSLAILGSGGTISGKSSSLTVVIKLWGFLI
ncbi:hypothetical protein L195_g025307 [Trifolium pratense]|uniref:Uncharacterized protein n=1 Tax=Trifolium pratense TaxID=57577 RepID=A0A2K3NG45_TRIPR|nr:hypothetical protein L195_g025307 [Trifolium pratense]